MDFKRGQLGEFHNYQKQPFVTTCSQGRTYETTCCNEVALNWYYEIY